MNRSTRSEYIVEDYILYKIHTKFSNFSRVTPIVQLDSTNKPVQEIPISANRRPATATNLSIRKIAAEYERRYESNFPEFINEIKTTVVSPDNVANTLKRLAQMLFRLPLKPVVQSVGASEVITEQANYNSYANNDGMLSYEDDHIKWGHIIGFMVFAGLLAVHAAELNNPEEVETIMDWVTDFYDTQLSGWLKKNGGWNALSRWNVHANGNVMNGYNDYDAAENVSIRSVMSVGVLAACVGFGAMIMSRK